MCGIAGFYQCSDSKDTRLNILTKMLTRIKHRGPDQSGVYLSNKIGLGSVRLSIVDLETGTMPLSNEEESLWIVFNGEIFNHPELKEELVQKGHTFKTTSDTEVIVHLYQEYGPDFISQLNGQFAIAIWDTIKEELFLARDRVGIRPFFYTQVNGAFVFASEIKAFLEYPELNLKISSKALQEYFTFWTAIPPHTLFKDVYELKPGHSLIVNSGGIKESRYWKVPIYTPKRQFKGSLEEASEKLDAIFKDAVRIRLRADVPVAAYLSGGLDSSIITATIKEVSTNKLKTFSIGFNEKEFDESDYQQIAVDYFKTSHASIKSSYKDIARVFPDVIWHTEAPILRTSPAPMNLLAGLVQKNNIKVVVTGEGADEICGGYNIFKESKIRKFWSKDPTSNLRPLLLKKLYPYLPWMKSVNITALKLFFGYKLSDVKSPIYSHVLRWHNTAHITSYLSQKIKDKIKGNDPIDRLEKELVKKLNNVDSLSKAQWLEMCLFMSGYLLSSQGDRMAMAHSIEGRYPFLDHRIIDFCMQLPSEYKLKGLNEKYLLKKMMKGKLPEEIRNRPKQAYRSPIRSAFAQEGLPLYLKSLLEVEKIKEFGLFNENHVGNLLKKMRSNHPVSEIDNMAITGILSTQIVYDTFIKRSRGSIEDKDILQLDKVIIQ
ncbi:asparagine synthase (glutamine-hydrolyzing) [Maribacter sp.]|uniref:asparagine synthase (glutamine-hydrolyzing) n=1 Tax=Maribacter sp. TaxID=1897614 RepID=UPI0025C3B85F|nr:asparagine synthase (glutamine-hydrolyzing) [Maribacter sp.]